MATCSLINATNSDIFNKIKPIKNNICENETTKNLAINKYKENKYSINDNNSNVINLPHLQTNPEAFTVYQKLINYANDKEGMCHEFHLLSQNEQKQFLLVNDVEYEETLKMDFEQVCNLVFLQFQELTKATEEINVIKNQPMLPCDKIVQNDINMELRKYKADLHEALNVYKSKYNDVINTIVKNINTKYNINGGRKRKTKRNKKRRVKTIKKRGKRLTKRSKSRRK